MWSRYTERALKAIELARDEARRLQWDCVDVGHLLLGLVREGKGLAAVALQNLGLDASALQAAVERLLGQGPGATGRELEFTPRAIQVLTEDAVAVARQVGHNYVGTEHILLALVRDPAGLPAAALASLGVAPEAVRSWILGHVLPPAKAPPPASDLPYTERLLRQVLPLAAEEARALGDDHVGTEHLLLGILRCGQGRAAELLARRGVTLEWVRSELMRQRDG